MGMSLRGPAAVERPDAGITGRALVGRSVALIFLPNNWRKSAFGRNVNGHFPVYIIFY
jgi:hypothetical protein